MKTTLIILLTFIGTLVFANGGEAAHDEGHIPFAQIGWQAANLGILVAALFFFIRKSIVETFAKRQQDFLDKSIKTKAALKEAEAALAEIKSKMTSLEAGEKKAYENAQQEAARLKENLIAEAGVATEKMKKDAELTMANELNKAKAEINALILETATASAAKKLSSTDQASSTQEAAFIKQLEQVRA